jgi:hypothetical protein
MNNSTFQAHQAIIELEHIAEQKEHRFINWWLGTFGLGLVTISVYLSYRSYKFIHAFDKHYEKTYQFYTQVPTVLAALAAESPNKANHAKLADSLQAYNLLLQNTATSKLFKPVKWGKQLMITNGSGMALNVLGNMLTTGIVPGFTQGFIAANPTSGLPTETITSMGVMFAQFCNGLLALPLIIYGVMVCRTLVMRQSQVEQFEQSLLPRIQEMLGYLDVTEVKTLEYTPQTDHNRKFSFHVLLCIFTLGFGALYSNYLMMTELEKRYTEETALQYRLLKLFKDKFNVLQDQKQLPASS